MGSFCRRDRAGPPLVLQESQCLRDVRSPGYRVRVRGLELVLVSVLGLGLVLVLGPGLRLGLGLGLGPGLRLGLEV